MICIPNERYFHRNNQMRYQFYAYNFSHAEIAAFHNLSISQVTKITRVHPPMYVYTAIPRWLMLYELMPGIDALFGTEFTKTRKPLQETK